MCGISGYYAFTDKSFANLAKIHQSTKRLALRGPDAGGVYIGDICALGHRRLSIIDTSTSANQPMADVSGRYRLVFNGEIYNFKELQSRLPLTTQKQFSSHSDTEVLLYLLIQHGQECLPWLSGFFAFAFLDTHTGNLLLARDRYGKKPLVYYRDSESLAFASEMKALLEFDIPRELNYTVLHQYLQLNYIPQPQSMLKGCSKLPPGNYMKISKGGEVEITAYYELQLDRSSYSKYTYDQAQQQLIEILDKSVQERMVADVPLGAFLSGGIDSSVIVALASKHTRQLNTFSIGYKDNPFFDETRYAKLVADKYKTNHTVFTLSNNDFLEHVDNVLDYLDEPFADSSAIPTYILCHHTRKKVTVALSGDGADEMFSGYNKHAAEWKVRQASLLNSLVKIGAPIWKTMPRSRGGKLTNLFRQLHRFAEGANLSARDRYWHWATFSTPQVAMSYIAPEKRALVDIPLEASLRNELLSAIGADDFNEVLLTDMKLVLTGDMLVKVDMMSMANSLEIRCPFLDYRLVDFAFGLPASYKLDGNMKKKIVQDAFRPLLPAELYNRPKHGFEIPLLGWLQNELWSMIDEDLLSDKFVLKQGIFDLGAIKMLKRRLRSNNPGDSHAAIWALIVFQYWWKKYFL